MTVQELCGEIGAEIAAGNTGCGREVCGCYIGDMMSTAMTKISEGNAWITVQTNVNAVAVAVMTSAACVVMCEGKAPDEVCIKRADEESVPVLISGLSAYEIARIFVKIGI